MPFWKIRSAAVYPLLITLVATRLPAAEKLDLGRITPVPATESIPIMDFFRPRLLQQPTLNAAGTYVAAIITAGEDRHQVLVTNLQTKEIEVAGGFGDKDVYGVEWLNSQRLVFSLGTRKLYAMGMLAAEAGHLRNAYAIVQYYNTRLLAVPYGDPLHPLVWNTYDSLDSGRDLGAATLDSDVDLGKMMDLDSGTGATMEALLKLRDQNDRHIQHRYPVPPRGITLGYLADRAGHLAYAFTADGARLGLCRLEHDQWIECPVDLESVDVFGPGDQPGQLVVRGPRQNGQPRALQMMDAATGTLGEVLVQDDAYDFDGSLYRSPVDRQLLGTSLDRDGVRMMWFNDDYRNLQKLLDRTSPGSIVRIIDSDKAQKIFLVAAYSDRQPVVYNVVDLAKHTVGLLKNSEPWIDPQRMRPMIPLKFKTRDGRHLDAYLTLPAGASKKNPPPLVVLPHGGPWARDTWGFDGEVQFLASRGYAVLQPNYRGSPGYDWMFPDEDRWDFRKMHDDVTDATKAMIASGLVDGKRVGIMGGSFGGYLAVAGVVNEPSLYRCAVTIAGVFDWARMIQDQKIDRYATPTYARMILKLGNPKDDPVRFDAISPGRHVDRIKVPVFVAGGGDDYTVDIEQSKHLIDDLEKYHVPHETFIVRTEGHGMHHIDHQVALYGRIEAFLAKNLMEAR